MKKTRGNKVWLGLALVAAVTVTGCGSPDVELMKTGLVKSGRDAASAQCFAEAMDKEGVKADPFNYAAKLMNEGMKEREAFNKARRKYGAEFLTPVRKARKSCEK